MVTIPEIALPHTAARGLRRWTRAVGGFYVLMGLFNSPPKWMVVHLVVSTTGMLAIRRSRS